MYLRTSSMLLPLYILYLLGMTSVTAQPVNCDQSAIPTSAWATLHRQFPDSHIVTVQNLDQDERTEWETRKSKTCPGVLHGIFSSGVEGYVVSLTSKAGEFRSKDTLVFLRKTANGYLIHVLSPTVEVTAHTYVLSMAPPGTYDPVESSVKTRIRWPMVIYEGRGAGSTGCFYAGGRWHSLDLSE